MSGVTFCVHTFVGGPRVAVPLLADTHLPIASKWLNYYCWHVTTIYLLLMSFAFVYVALDPEEIVLVIFLSILNSCLSILSSVVAIKGKINPFKFPSTLLFAIVSVLGFLSIAAR